MVLLLAGGSAIAASPRTRRHNQLLKPNGAVHLQVKNCLFHVMDEVVLSVPSLDAWMIPMPGQTVSLDSKSSFLLQINSGGTYLKARDLTALLNDYLLPHAKTPIKNITVAYEGSEIVVKGELHKVVDIPFRAKGTVSVADDGDIRVHFKELKAAGVINKGLLDFLGIKLSDIAQPKKQSRFRIDGYDLLFPITALFPPPRVVGKLTAVRIEGDGLVQIFGPANAAIPPPPTPAKNYVYFHGGRMKFGKLTMDDVDLQLVDKDASNSFDVSLDHYAEQLDAGYSKSLPSLGLLVFMPDYSTVAKSPHLESKATKSPSP
jgi:hypothetical protein